MPDPVQATLSKPSPALQCRYCLRVRDDRTWTLLSTYLDRHGLPPSDVTLVETYCDLCLEASYRCGMDWQLR